MKFWLQRKMSKIIEAEKIYQEAREGFERAKQVKDDLKARDACSKGWLAAVKATEALFLAKGLKEEELPKTHRGMRYFLAKYGDKEVRRLFSSIRDTLHIDGYYDGIVDFEELPEHLDAVGEYIERVRNLSS